MFNKNRHVELKKQDYNDIIYFDATIYNDNTEVDNQRTKIADFNTTLVGSILNKPSDYYITIARFSISHMEIPIYFFKSNFYSVSISGDNGVTWHQRFLAYDDVNSIDAKQSYGFSSTVQPVYYYNQVVVMINDALDNAHTAAGVGDEPPFIIYDEINEKFNIYARRSTYVDGAAQIAFNSNLFQQFQYFKAFNVGLNQPDGVDYILLMDLLPEPSLSTQTVNGTEYFVLPQERSALYLFNEVQNIVFTSNAIPVNREYLEISNRGNGRPISLPVLADFVPDLSKGRDLSEYQFYPQGPYRLIDLNSDTPLNSLDIQINFVTRDGQIFRLYLEPGEVATVKLAFLKKDSYTW